VKAESPSVTEARRRADDARGRLIATLEEIVDFAEDMLDSLTPHNIARDAWEAAKNKGADMAEDAVDAVRKRPVAASGAVAALALFIAREPLMDFANKLLNSNDKIKPGKRRKAPKEPVESKQ
jgi:hypothetical protein